MTDQLRIVAWPAQVLLTVAVENVGVGHYEGHNVSLNGVPLWHRPYDGGGEAEAAREVAEALCEVLRAHTGRTLAEEESDDDG